MTNSVRFPTALALMMCLSVLALTTFTMAAWGTTSQSLTELANDVLTGDTFAITASAGNQTSPAIAYNAQANTFLVVWVDDTNAGTAKDLCAQRLDGDGIGVGDALTITMAASDQVEPAIAARGQTPDYVVAWRDLRNGLVTDNDIYAQVITPGGILPADVAISTRPGRQRQPAIAHCPTTGTYLVAWDEDEDEDEDAQWAWSFYIFGQQISDTALPLGETLTVTADYPSPGFQQVAADIVHNSRRDEYLVVYRDARNHEQGADYNDDIYGQRLSCDGTRLLEEDLPISTQYSPAPDGNKQNAPAVAYDAWHDHYLVVWQDERNDPDASSTNDHLDVYGQVLSGDGAPLSTSADANFSISTAAGNQHQPDTAFSSQAGIYLVVWVDQRGADADIYGRFLGPTGALWSQEVVISDAPGDQLAPAVTYNGDDDRFFVVWQDQRNEATNGADIYGRLLVPPEVYRQYLPLVSRKNVTVDWVQGSAKGGDGFAWEIETEHMHRASGISPTLQFLAFQPSDIGYLFTARVDGALPQTQYVISSYHHTDIDYWQDTITVTTDSAGAASARTWSRCSSGYAFARLSQASDPQAVSNLLDCPSIQTVGDFGSQLADEPANDDWIYRPAPPGSDTIDLWIVDRAARAGLTATVSIHSAKTGYLLSEEPMTDELNGLYTYTWPIGGLPQASDYRVQLTLDDGAEGLSGADALVKLSGRAMWIWGQANGEANPTVWAILTNEDQDRNGKGDRDEWLAFCNAPYGVPDPYVTTSYLSVYPYLNPSGTQVADTFRSFLTTAHATGSLRVEALAGTYEWVESDGGLQDGKAMCQAIVTYNRDDATSPAERFDGIHFDVEHDTWTAERWARYLDLITTCQAQVDAYNQSHEAIVFGVDVPPHFLTGPASTGQVKSAWDVLSFVDYVTLMDYRDFADVRPGDGRTDGIIPRAVPFVVDGNTLGKPVVIGVELTPNPYDHVTFHEECPAYMEAEIGKVSRHFAGEWAYKGIAIHSYDAWKGKGCVFLPLALKGGN